MREIWTLRKDKNRSEENYLQQYMYVYLFILIKNIYFFKFNFSKEMVPRNDTPSMFAFRVS